jgi:hypothetical protein
MSQIKLKIDARSRTIEIEATGESFESVAIKAESILEKLAELQPEDQDQDQDRHVSPDGEGAAESEEEVQGEAKTNTRDRPSTRKRGRAGSGKTSNWKMVNDLLDEAGRSKLKAFFEEKKPASQNEKVAVLAVKLKELTGRDGFDGNEIYTAFQIVGTKTPANLKAVFGNLTGAGWGGQLDKKFVPNFKAEDTVKHDLPPKIADK